MRGVGNKEYLVYCKPLQLPPSQQFLPTQEQLRRKDAKMIVWNINQVNTKKLLWCRYSQFGFTHEMAARNAAF